MPYGLQIMNVKQIVDLFCYDTCHLELANYLTKRILLVIG